MALLSKQRFRFSHNKQKCEPIANPSDRPWTARIIRLVKQLTPLYEVRIYLNYHNQGKNAVTSPYYSDECPSSSLWRKLNASYVMSATDSPPRCKDKNNLANNVHVSRIFCKSSSFFLISATPYRYFLHFCFVFIRFTILSRAKIRKKDETAIIHFVHFVFCLRNLGVMEWELLSFD